MRTVERKIKIKITPTVKEVAEIIGDMSDKEQVELLVLLDPLCFNKEKGYLPIERLAKRVGTLSKRNRTPIQHLVLSLFEYLVE